MSIVGEFPGLGANRRVIRAPVNPLDLSTIVSIYPKEIEEIKHTIDPGRFYINKGSYDNPAILVVGPSSWWRDIDDTQPMLEIPQSSIQIADSFVKDYCNGILGCNMGNSMPGLFYIPGKYDIEGLKKAFKGELDSANKKQQNFYSALIKLADSLWARSNGNPLVISDDMRMAARELNLTSQKDWMKDFEMMDMSRCKACGSLRNAAYPICPTCRAIDDPERAKTLGIKFAAQ